ncbi:hypothetical protein TVAG_259260 [Trichomonas vaginalis G3]|uniref:Uncharacterized protein n=1 Tax=Trichomonas vaginalis (strain ATCC PRA-98 / G3) TaxID=412133 RepID=A2EBX7_TRIV3|nr:hypothetical protein TVAGG3_0652530 [Trichomonas vaginalis G3]EAY09845.1 hypothetical protein TVAG_259260 [Trichomonas vaginalis G3]KAI5505925.1 hypothetical protein TVAGG3_0652530 [Trichomonas vaginalis G3]|eukprot:XP_001322068.1 hypothetical protein [Trichomonas vaginalis G3]
MAKNRFKLLCRHERANTLTSSPLSTASPKQNTQNTTYYQTNNYSSSSCSESSSLSSPSLSTSPIQQNVQNYAMQNMNFAEQIVQASNVVQSYEDSAFPFAFNEEEDLFNSFNFEESLAF